MSTNVMSTRATLAVTPAASEHTWTRYGVPVARTLFAALFLIAGPRHFMPATITSAAEQGVPFASVVVPASGVLALLGGLSVMIGYRARAGAALLVLFLVPVTFAMHAFWTAADAQTAQIQATMFFKNLSLIGAGMLISHFGAGPYSLDARQGRR